jgi:DNA-binding MarR family transcriptional regulator
MLPATVATETASRLRLVIARLARLLRQQTLDNEVTVSMFSALASIERLGLVSLGELAAVERVQPPSMTRIVSRLEELGLVTRAIDAADRRIARVQATTEGTRFLQRNRTRRNAFLAARMRKLSVEELAALEAALPVMEKLLEGER